MAVLVKVGYPPTPQMPEKSIPKDRRTDKLSSVQKKGAFGTQKELQQYWCVGEEGCNASPLLVIEDRPWHTTEKPLDG